MLVFRRVEDVAEPSTTVSWRELLSMCGKLVGHYPIEEWLCTACSCTMTRAEGYIWGDKVEEWTVETIWEILESIRAKVRGYWHVPKLNNGTTWCDASNICTGAVSEM